MTASKDNFMRDSERILKLSGASEEIVQQTQQHLIKVALFLSENNIKELDSVHVPNHLLGEYDRLAFEMEEIPGAQEAFEALDEKSLLDLRRVCETLSDDFSQQKIVQLESVPQEERRSRFTKDIETILQPYKVDEAIQSRLQDQLSTLSNFMIENKIQYLDINEWPESLQPDFERFAEAFDSLVEQNPSLEGIGEDKLHSLLHRCELFVNWEISLCPMDYVSLDSYDSLALKTSIEEFFKKEGTPAQEAQDLSSKVEKIASFMRKNDIHDMKIESAPKELQDVFSGLIQEVTECDAAKKYLSEDKMKEVRNRLHW